MLLNKLKNKCPLEIDWMQTFQKVIYHTTFSTLQKALDLSYFQVIHLRVKTENDFTAVNKTTEFVIICGNEAINGTKMM